MWIKRTLIGLLLLWSLFSALLILDDYIGSAEPVSFEVTHTFGAFTVPRKLTDSMEAYAVIDPDYGNLTTNKFVFTLPGESALERKVEYCWPELDQASTSVTVIDADGDGLHEVLCMGMTETRMLWVSDGQVCFRKAQDCTPNPSGVIVITAWKGNMAYFLVEMTGGERVQYFVYTWDRGNGFQVHLDRSTVKEVLESFTRKFY